MLRLARHRTCGHILLSMNMDNFVEQGYRTLYIHVDVYV